ncbi:hypothetical protein QYM36_009514 [Artemia franciscana]|uniref:tRNA-intron lyase n=1 Tax=Artemia franciscana TaxID=6661 RepID=A0AA88HM23_ARTSF|nr:hypothetical protein QYM36_009514 [Artemia franciscana]
MVISQVPRTILWQFLWKTSNILYLRKELRIVGQLEGCLASLPRQLNLCGRPLRLMNEEAHFLLKNNYCELLSCSDLASPPTKQSADNFKEIQNRAFEEQRLLVKEEKMQQILRAGEKILEGKRRKLNKEAAKSGNEPPPLTLEQAVDEEIRRIPELTQANALVQIFTGDPVRFHAKYIAICLPFEGLLTPFQIAVHARVAVSVNKKVLLCTVNSDSRVIYKYLEWLDAKREKMSQETIK